MPSKSVGVGSMDADANAVVDKRDSKKSKKKKDKKVSRLLFAVLDG